MLVARGQNAWGMNASPAKAIAPRPVAGQTTASRSEEARPFKVDVRRAKIVKETRWAVRNRRLIGEPASSAEIAARAGLHFSQAKVMNRTAKPPIPRSIQYPQVRRLPAKPSLPRRTPVKSNSEENASARSIRRGRNPVGFQLREKGAAWECASTAR